MTPLDIGLIGLSLGTGLLSGASSARTARDNAAAAQAAAQRNAAAAQSAALQNARFTMAAGQATASMIGAVGQQNAAMQMMTAQLATSSLEALALHNAKVQTMVTSYTNLLLDEELDQLFDDYALDSLYLRNTAARTEGALLAYQASSGTVIGEGSNADVLVDSRTQAALDQAVLRYDFDRKAADIRNAQARSSWEGQVAITNMQYEATVEGLNTLTQGRLNAASILAQSALDAGVTLVNATANAFSIRSQGTAQAATYLSEGQAQYGQYMNQARQSFNAGVLNGISNAALSFAAAYNPAPKTTSTLPASQVAPLAINYQPSYGTSPGTSLMLS